MPETELWQRAKWSDEITTVFEDLRYILCRSWRTIDVWRASVEHVKG
jgi:hypothetical protein